MVYGMGINDVKGDCKGPYYTRWMSMIQRCYDKGALSRDKKYEGVTVCKEWLTFSNFRDWMESQDWEGKQLDKDLLGGKVYSPETCLFISPHLNRFLTGARTKGLVGASFEPDRNKWKASIKSPMGKSRTLGRYDTEVEAHKVYLVAKARYLMEFIDLDDLRLSSAINNHITSLRERWESLSGENNESW